MAESNAAKTPLIISFSARASIHGAEGNLQFTGTLADIRDACELIASGGAKHIRFVTETKAWQTTPDGRPICPKHGVPMKQREKQGDEWWSHNVAGEGQDPVYCKGYQGKDSPGWEYVEHLAASRRGGGGRS